MYPITHYPKYAKKYPGCIEKLKLKTKTSYRLTIKTHGVHFTKCFASYDEAFQMMKAKSLEYQLPIKNMIFEYEDYMVVGLTRGKQCKFDKEDRDLVEMHTWSYHDGYAYTVHEERGKRLHGMIMNHEPTPFSTVDHINRDSLDNRRANLRIADARTQALNQNIKKSNTSGFCGVCLLAHKNSWASIWVSEDGIRKTKSFSINKYGPEMAKQLAIDHRQMIVTELPHYVNARS